MQGTAAADATSTAFYLSANAVLDAADVLLGSHPVPPLDPTAAYTASTAVQVPASTLTGTYYVLAVADAGSRVAEANETNNTAAAVMRVGPDLIASALAAPSSAVSGAALTVTDTVRNQGGGAAGGSATRFYLSTNASFDTSDTLLASRPVGPLDPGGTDSGPIAGDAARWLADGVVLPHCGRGRRGAGHGDDGKQQLACGAGACDRGALTCRSRSCDRITPSNG